MVEKLKIYIEILQLVKSQVSCFRMNFSLNPAFSTQVCSNVETLNLNRIMFAAGGSFIYGYVVTR